MCYLDEIIQHAKTSFMQVQVYYINDTVLLVTR